MKIKLHDKNETIIELDIIIYVEKGMDSIFIQSENNSFTIDYEDIREDYESEKTTLERDYELIYDSICTDIEKLKEENEALNKNLENNRRAYEKLYVEYKKANERASLDWIRADDKDGQIKEAIKYINEHNILKKKELLKILN